MPVFAPDPSPSVELIDERACRWSEEDVPVPERGVSFAWLNAFVDSYCWTRNAPVWEQRSLRDRARQWDDHARWSMDDLPTPEEFKDVSLSDAPPEFYETTIHDLVADHIIPLTQTIRAPLYARVPLSERGKPEVFLSHAWSNSVRSPVPWWKGGTLDAFMSEGIVGIKEKYVWIDFACYNQHIVASDTIAFDMEAIIRSIGNVAFAVTMTPLFDRIWCLWEVLSVAKTEAKARFCVAPGYRTDKRVMVNKFFEAFRSVEEAQATKAGDREKLLAAMIARFGSIDAANDHIRNKMRDGMGNKWFELAAR